MSQEERSEALIEVLEALQESDIGFVLVGGYAVSQFETRFSTDLDIVIAPEDYDEVVAFLEAHAFERQDEL
ncbi:MAG: nucleotidyltransferase family protein [Natrialbaceae archaeon]|nr:nucleotidyltransferase family protein [Natrialbaceae archaeon]